MESGGPIDPGASGERLSGEELRRTTFPQALRGYDREAVHAVLDRVADWVEDKAGSVAEASPAMRSELEKVGERTVGILTAAEDAARNLRNEAVEYAERLRSEVEDESRVARLNASQRMDEMIADAEKKAEKIIEDAIGRRRQLNQAISSLIERRDEIASEAARLGEELLDAVDALRSPDADDEPAPEPVSPDAPEAVELEDPGSEETELADEVELEPESGEHTADEVDSEETEIFEPDSEETEIHEPATLLIDPDAEDETPPR